jgi:hypothetical protein
MVLEFFFGVNSSKLNRSNSRVIMRPADVNKDGLPVFLLQRVWIFSPKTTRLGALN